jgi:hypothetical protein
MSNDLTIQLHALEKAVYWFLCERSAQMGEAYTLSMHEQAIAEDQDYISDIRFQVKSAIKAYLAEVQCEYSEGNK